jgi:hydrogenase maturation protein HypF
MIVAPLAGFTRGQSFEGQAAMWLEHAARSSVAVEAYPFPFVNRQADYRPLLEAIVADRLANRDVAEIAFAFHAAVAGLVAAIAREFSDVPVAVSGGVFQNALLMELLGSTLGDRLCCNHRVPPNDGGLSLGQAALAAFTC